MKILITSDWYAPTVNGVVTSVINLQRELNNQGHDVRILTLSDTVQSHKKDSVVYIGAVSAGKIYPGARLRAKPGLSLMQELVDWRPDVIHTQCEFSTFRMARKIADAVGCPIVHTYHTVYEDYTHYFSPSVKWGRQLVSLLSRQILRKTEQVIVPTKKVRNLLEGYGVERPIHVIPTGIDLRKFTGEIDSAKTAALKASLGLSPEQFVLLYVGRLAEEKNIGEILHNLAQQKSENVVLVLVGDGPYRDALKEQVRALDLSDRVVFTGMINPKHVPDYYRMGDLFVSASNSETQGLTYIEALAAGLPALCRMDDCLEHVIENGVNGWQFRTSAEFQQYLEQFCADPVLRQQMAEAARNSAQQNFSAAAFARRVSTVYWASINSYRNVHLQRRYLSSIRAAK